jgi:hypothetical protein
VPSRSNSGSLSTHKRFFIYEGRNGFCPYTISFARVEMDSALYIPFTFFDTIQIKFKD